MLLFHYTMGLGGGWVGPKHRVPLEIAGK
jgi:hypothetical protein